MLSIATFAMALSLTGGQQPSAPSCITQQKVLKLWLRSQRDEIPTDQCEDWGRRRWSIRLVVRWWSDSEHWAK